MTINGNDLFRGFFFQARDAQTQEWIGSWVDSPNTNSIPECSSITHADNRDKTVSAKLLKYFFNLLTLSLFQLFSKHFLYGRHQQINPDKFSLRKSIIIFLRAQFSSRVAKIKIKRRENAHLPVLA